MTQHLLIDSDPGIDDALAILLALRSPDARVEAVTTVAGNVAVELATANARRILSVAAPDPAPPLASGAPAPLKRALITAHQVHGQDGLGNLERFVEPNGQPRYPEPTYAIEMRSGPEVILDAADRWGPDLTVVALGPLTNLALALQQDPRRLGRVGRIVVMGGAIAVPGNITPAAEFNFYVDPEAAAAVLEAGLPVELVPLDVTRRVVLAQTALTERLLRCSDRVARFILDFTLHGFAFGAERENGGIVLHDPLAMAVALDPSLVTLDPLHVEVECEGRLAPRPLARRSPGDPVASEARAHLSRGGGRGRRARAPHGPGAPVPRSRDRLRQRRLHGGAAAPAPGGRDGLRGDAPGEPRRQGRQPGGGRAAAGRRGADDRLRGRRRLRRRHPRAGLPEQGIGVDGLVATPEAATGTALISVDREGQNQIGGRPGRESPAHGRYGAARRRCDRLGRGACSASSRSRLPVVRWALEAARRHDAVTILNPAPAQALSDDLLALVGYLTPNAGEVMALTGIEVHDLDSGRQAAARLVERGAGPVIVTLGDRARSSATAASVTHFVDSPSPVSGCARLYYPGFMGRPFAQVTLADAVGRLRPGMKVLLAPGCGDPTALVAEILRQADRLAPLTLMGGLRLDDYPFGAPAYAGKIRFATWHMSPRLAAAAARGDVDFVPARYFDTVSLFAAGGPWAPDAVLVHTAPPDRGGYLSLGVSVSYLLPAARRAPLVIAQVNPRMPRTLGNAFLHRSQVDVWTPVDHPLLEYPPTPSGTSSGASPATSPTSSRTGRRSRWAWARSRRR